MAKDTLHDTEEYQVVGGFLSPVSDFYNKSGLAPAQDRLAMCRLAIADSTWIEVDSWESHQTTYQRTLQVLDSLQERLSSLIPNVKVMFLAGADLIQSFSIPDLWSEQDRISILDKYGCIVVDRWNHDISEFLLLDHILYRFRKRILVAKQFISNDISSTKIR